MLDELDRRISEIEDVLDSLIKKNGYSYNEYAVLYSLGKTVDRDCTQKKISEEWYIPKQTVYNICQELHKKGWIVFVQSQEDKREKNIRLTDVGRPYATELFVKAESFSAVVLKKFGINKAQKLYELLDLLKDICKQEVEKLPAQHMIIKTRKRSKSLTQ